ncbi:AraC family transcriptional regulator [Herbaspirillum sp. alder98]|uniref:AraC family transcriptional regulator n=1 Tax=Herbaspirillum sp. alder98 TaxID=2913096 RepID=UPI001CD8D01A|nr:helix-turn-helix transcriptional regulator [Herbaspirillum sp. alder98]MCA1325354.1 helix-turn-helix transcriptional regulator [Herbaspirillum sp. alder98]
MRNTSVDLYEELPRSVVVTANDFAAGLMFPQHSHQRGQFAFASRGTISVSTCSGQWLVPPQRACWIPAGMAHTMTMGGPVTMLNAFISSEASMAAQMPMDCCVYGVSMLLRNLLEEAIDLPVMYEIEARAGKLMALLVAEIASMPRLSLHAPLPRDPRLAEACRRLFHTPSVATGLDHMAAEVSMSRRTFTRFFREQTGMSFADWRQQVCLLSAIARLNDGESVTRVALDLGYASPSAFSSAFRRVLGVAPSQYIEAQQNAVKMPIS